MTDDLAATPSDGPSPITVIALIAIVVLLARGLYFWHRERERKYWDGYTLVGWRKYGTVSYEFRFQNGVVIRSRRYYPSGDSVYALGSLWGYLATLEKQIEWGKHDAIRIPTPEGSDEEPSNP